jgi:hypothetical protein
MSIMRKLLLVGVFIAGLVIGAGVGGWWSGRVLSRLTMSKEVELASMAAFEAEWLAQLRLNEVDSAIKDIENSMDIQVSTLAQWNEANPPDEKTRKARDRWLVPVKVYHESYAVTGNEAARIEALLATIPGRSPNSACKSGICRLDDWRIGLLNTNKNRAIK